MGEQVSCIAHVGTVYKHFLFTVCDYYRSTNERILLELFDQISEDIGTTNVVVRPLRKGLADFEKLFDIKYSDKRPVLVITDKHPLDLLQDKNDGVSPEYIKISLGGITNEDALRQLLREITYLVKSEEYNTIAWRARKTKIDQFINNHGIVGIAVSLVPL